MSASSVPKMIRGKKPSAKADVSPQAQTRVGRIISVGDGRLEVEIDRFKYAAQSTIRIGAADVGREAVILFARGHVRQPIIVGLIHVDPIATEATVRLDGERLILSAAREIVLECGDASITLTRAGKVLIRGAYVSSKSTGLNRIKGASVQIN